MQSSKLIPQHVFAPLEGEAAIDMQELRLPGNLNNCLRVQPAAFDSQRYKVEDSVLFKDESGV